MLSKRNLVMMLTMFGVVLVLFLSSVVLKEYFNDYHVNRWAKTERLPREADSEDARQRVVYVGAQDTGFYQPIQQWARYRKMAFQETQDVHTGLQLAEAYEKEDVFLLLDGSALEGDPQYAAESLTDYVRQGGTAIFCSLPAYQTIQDCDPLRRLLGIQKLRSESVELLEYWLYSGFLLGGEVCYAFDELQPPERLDMQRVIPWYDISAGTKSYMVGYITSREKDEMGLSREDMPAVIWRSSTGKGCVFAVNGDFMNGQTALGLLDAMVYESRDYALYAVVNAQNLSVTGFPDLTSENEELLKRVYVFNSQQFCRDILWPSLVAAADSGDWKLSAFLSVKQSGDSQKEPDMASLIEYLKYYNEQSAEAGLCLGRKSDEDIRRSMAEDQEKLEKLGVGYAFTGGYLRSENEAQLPQLMTQEGYLDLFSDLRTVVTERSEEQPVVSWQTDQITSQRITMDGYRYTYQDDLRLKSLQTALGYSNVQADIYRVLWLENSADAWEQVAETFAANIATHWKPFAVFDKTTITESDRRTRMFLNEKVSSQSSLTGDGRQISVQVTNFAGEAWLMLRTHGEVVASMEGGTWKQIEQDAYLLHLTSPAAEITLQPRQSGFYYMGT